MNYSKMVASMVKKMNDDEEAPEQPNTEVYKDQLNFREILLTGDVTDSLIEKAVIPIINFNRYDEQMEAKIKDYVREPIKILIHTSGGSIDPTMSLISAIKSSVTPIYTMALGKAYSAGFLILIAGHKRFMQEYSTVMLHPGSSGYIGSFPSILKHADKIHELSERLNDYVIEHTAISREDVEEMNEHEYDWYMYAEEALCRGVVDGIIKGPDIISLDDYIEAIKEEEKKAAEAEKEAKKAVAKKPAAKKPASKKASAKNTKPKTTKEKIID